MNADKKKLINKCLIGIKNRDKECLDLLYDLIAPTIRYISLKYLKNTNDADDLVQDFWADIFRLADNFVLIQNGFRYLCKAMTRKALNRCEKIGREKNKFVELVEYDKLKNNEIINFTPEIDLKIAVESVMEELDEIEKIVVQKTYFEDKAIREIAKELKCSKSQVGRIKLEAQDKLKQGLTRLGWDK